MAMMGTLDTKLLRGYYILVSNPEPDILQVGRSLLGEVHHHASALTIGIDARSS